MTSKNLKKRRLKILRKIGRAAKGRHDVKVLLSGLEPSLDLKGFYKGRKFVDKDNPVFEEGSSVAYDFNTLKEEGLIEEHYMSQVVNAYGQCIPQDAAVKVTQMGFEALVEARKTWLTKSIEKQPITFLNILVTLFFSAASAYTGFEFGKRTALKPSQTSDNASSGSSVVEENQGVEQVVSPKSDRAGG